MIRITDFISSFPAELLAQVRDQQPWQIVSGLEKILGAFTTLPHSEYHVRGHIVIHRSATVEEGAVIKGPAVIGKNSFVGAHAYLRGGVFLGENVTVGPGCELKSSVVLAHSRLAHFNFVGDSIIGQDVNLEAGAVIANHFNERADKQITIHHNGKMMATGCEKFGALVGDHCRIGANAVLSPGTILAPNTIVKRLELVDQSAHTR